MVLQFYNTLGKKKEEFIPLRGKIVRIWTCGLTVYNFGHIGNFRSYIFADILRRYLEYKGYDVKQVMNFTDVGHMIQDDIADSRGQDKMEKAAEREHKTPWEIADFYIKAFLEDSKTLNLKEPEVRPKATEHIKEMQEIIKKLIDNGYAYVVNGNVYFEVKKFKDYGKLSGNKIENLQAGAGGRVEENSEKKNPLDFALWVNDPKHIMKWKSPWGGEGYPGWHIECSAMSTKYLGDTFDIHTGGEDNIFPHHECEIAQTEGATGKKFVNYWLHARHLLVNGEKMSKSKGNFYTVRDLLAQGYKPMQIRYALLSAHYRQPLDFSLDYLKSCGTVIQRFKDFVKRLKEANGKGTNVDELIKKSEENFEKAMNDDLNISDALKAVFDFMHEVNKKIDAKEIGGGNAQKILKAFNWFDCVLGLNISKEGNVEDLKEKIIPIYQEIARTTEVDNKTAQDMVEHMVAIRKNMREMTEYKEADKIRMKLEKIGIVLEDSGKTKWKLKA